MFRRKPPPPQDSSKWEVPEASGSRDLWNSPGHAGPTSSGSRHASHTSPFECRHCGERMAAREAYAYEGDMYCAACRPQGAVSGRGGLSQLLDDPLGGLRRWLRRR